MLKPYRTVTAPCCTVTATYCSQPHVPSSIVFHHLFPSKLIKPDEMNDPKVDELSMMTYLSQYPQAKLKPGAPVQAGANPARVRCYGKGVEPTGNLIDAPTNFFVETFSAGQGDVQVTIINPKGQIEPVSLLSSQPSSQFQLLSLRFLHLLHDFKSLGNQQLKSILCFSIQNVQIVPSNPVRTLTHV